MKEMKKTLSNIFDEANAREIGNLVSKNTASDVSEDTLAAIKSKVYTKTGLYGAKKRRFSFFGLKPSAVKGGSTKRKLKTALLVFCALVYCFAVIKANFFTVSASFEEFPDPPSIFDDDPWKILQDSLTEEQAEKFRACGYLTSGFYNRPLELAVALGKTDGRLHRMTLEEAKTIVELNKDKGKEALFRAFNERQPYPDKAGGGGMYHYIYWLNAEGSEIIILYPRQGAVSYMARDLETGERISYEVLLDSKAYQQTTSEPAQVN